MEQRARRRAASPGSSSIFIHCAGASAHEADSKLAASLQSELGADWDVECPKLPEERPEYQLWTADIRKACARCNQPTFFVGHSFGGSLLVKYLSEEPTPPPTAGIFIIAAPYWGRGRLVGRGVRAEPGFRVEASEAGAGFSLSGRNDSVVPFAHLAPYREKLPQARVCELSGRDHQLNDDLSETAREILRHVLEYALIQAALHGRLPVAEHRPQMVSLNVRAEE